MHTFLYINMINFSSMLYKRQYIPQHLHRRNCYVLSADCVGSAYYTNFSIDFNMSSKLVGLTLLRCELRYAHNVGLGSDHVIFVNQHFERSLETWLV